MPGAVPASDLPSNLVPASDLPDNEELRQAILRAQQSVGAQNEALSNLAAGLNVPAARNMAQILGNVGLSAGGSLAGTAAGTAFPVLGPATPMVGESLGGAAGEMLSQVLGLSQPSLTNIGIAAAGGPLARGAISGGKLLLKGGAELLNPQLIRKAAEQVMVEPPKTGISKYIAPSLGLGGKPSGPLFQAARQAGPVPTAGINAELQNTLGTLQSLSTPNKQAIDRVQNLINKYLPRTDAGYDDLIREEQALYRAARTAQRAGDSDTAFHLHSARGALLDAMDEVSPAIKEANRAYRLEQSLNQLKQISRYANPAPKLRTAIEKDKVLRETFNDEQWVAIHNLFEDIPPSTGQVMGVGTRILQAMGEIANAAMQTRAGAALLRTFFKEPGITRPIAAAGTQAIRAATLGGPSEQQPTISGFQPE